MLESFQHELKDGASSNNLKLKMDVHTRWNSTLDMLMRTIQLMEPINQFLAFYNSAAGRREFQDVTTKLPLISDEKWAIIQGICYLLSPFAKAMKIISGEKYATFTSTLPVLRRIKNYIGDPNLFKFDAQHLTKTKHKFFDLYGDMPCFGHTMRKLEACHLLLHRQFCEWFSGLDTTIMWTSLLDPKFGLKSPHWKDDEERSLAKGLLIKEVESLASASNVQATHEGTSIVRFGPSGMSSSEDDFDFNFSTQPKNASIVEEEAIQKAKLKICVAQEVEAYLLEIELCDVVDSLEWWHIMCHKYPHVTNAARKWLAVTVTSTPSEWVFSICGVLDTAKRSKLLGESIQGQVFVHNNYKVCQSTQLASDS